MLDDAEDIHPLFHGAPKGPEFARLRKRLAQQVREAVETYGMARAGDPLAGLPVWRQGQLYPAGDPALMNVRASHLADPALFDFAGLLASSALADRDNSLQLSAEH